MTNRTDDMGWPALPRGAVGPWLHEGARTAFLRQPRIERLQASPATPALLVLLLLIAIAVSALWQRLMIDGAAEFGWRALASGWLSTLIVAWLCWWAARPEAEGQCRAPNGPALFALLTAQQITLISVTSTVLLALSRLPESSWTAWAQWGSWWATLAWLLLAELRLLWRRLPARWQPRAALVALAAGGLAMQVLVPPQPLWMPRFDERAAAAAESRFMRLTPELIEQQQRATDAAFAALRPQRPGRVDLFVLSFAPYGSEDVFLRESALVASVLTERFDAQGHVLQLVNHPRTAAQLPWATQGNLERAIARMAALMDRDEDVLLIHLTSHGARDGQLAASLHPLELSALTPQRLRAALDAAGVRYRVLSVSACYSGSWIEPLAGDTTLVMTAADADHTSYGCGARSTLTFFGRAMFDEQLRRTRSFEQAHMAARDVIAQREREAGKSDGYSNPQIRVGTGIREPLARLAAQLEDDGDPQAAAAYNARPVLDATR